MKRALVTGGAGFIGSAVCRHLAGEKGWAVLNLDALTYAASLGSLRDLDGLPHYSFIQADIRDRAAVTAAFDDFKPDAVLHLAAESHVDRSIDDPSPFVETNIIGTFTLLEVARAYWRRLDESARAAFRFVTVSTDEVYGSLGETGAFSETTPYDPRSPYSASKAAADHLTRAWFETYDLPTIVSNCSNNYGPFHFPEKLIPLIILNAMQGRPLPVYGDGGQVRDWLHVEDHARALGIILENGAPGGRYNIGGGNERTNLDVVQTICGLLQQLKPGAAPYRDLITHVADRPGHDRRYAVDSSKLATELGWTPRETFETGLDKTVRWYLDNDWWWGPLRRAYDGKRLGLGDGKP